MYNKTIILHNVHLTNGTMATLQVPVNGSLAKKVIDLDGTDCLVFPGLVNSHDHLHFNLFPQLGNRVYGNYVEWGNDIHIKNKQEIKDVLRIDKRLRTQWGIYKNLIAGVTTVVHHGEELDILSPLINVCRQCYSLHSVQLEKKWRYRLNRPFRNDWPFAVHIGEGTDQLCVDEIDTLLKWNLLKRRMVGIHAVAMNEQQAKGFEALVWCPQSNFFLLGNTARMDQLKSATRILFGTDSTVSSEWNIWSHLRSARQTGMLTDAELMATVTNNAAAVWRLQDMKPVHNEIGGDLVLARKKQTNVADAFFAVDPADILLVLCNGVPVLFDGTLADHFINDGKTYSRIYVEGIEKFVIGNITSLIQTIKKAGVAINLPVETD